MRKRYFGTVPLGSTELNYVFQVDEFLSLVKQAIEKYESQTTRGSKQLQNSIQEFLENAGVNLGFKFQPITEKTQANYELDFLRTQKTNGMSLYLGGELAFDNRQVIFTNVIKADLAMKRLREASHESLSLSVLISFCADSRSLASWDGSVATFEEYAQQLEWGLEAYLTGPLLLLGLRTTKGAVD